MWLDNGFVHSLCDCDCDYYHIQKTADNELLGPGCQTQLKFTHIIIIILYQCYDYCSCLRAQALTYNLVIRTQMVYNK